MYSFLFNGYRTLSSEIKLWERVAALTYAEVKNGENIPPFLHTA